MTPKQASEQAIFHPLRLQLRGVELVGCYWGEGERILLCLHGYREGKERFVGLLHKPPPNTTVIALDLPLDGESHVSRPIPKLSGTWFREFWEALKRQFPRKVWYFLGFSQGGRWAILLQHYGDYPAKEVFLLAPDGLKSHWGHRLVQGPVGQVLFQPLLKRPKWIFAMANTLQKVGILPKSIMGMLRYVFRGPETLQHLRDTLRMQQHMHVSHRWITASSSRVVWHILWGEQDELVHNQKGLIQKLGPAITYVPLKARHDLLSEIPAEIQQYVQSCLR